MKRWMMGIAALIVVLSACSPAAKPDTTGPPIELAPVSALSPEVQKAPLMVRQAYQFAIANPDLLKPIPCYCGCGAVGHTSNLDCYVQEFKPDGSLVFDRHALG